MRWMVMLLGVWTAADAAVGDVRAGYERAGSAYHLTVDGPAGHDADDHHWDRDHGGFVELGARLPLVRVAVGAFMRRSEDDGAVDVLADRYGGRLTAGVSFALLPTLLHLELMPYVALGQARLRYADQDDHATFSEYGVHLDAVATLTRVVAGLGVGAAFSDTTFNVRVPGGSADVELREHVPVVRGFVGFSF